MVIIEKCFLLLQKLFTYIENVQNLQVTLNDKNVHNKIFLISSYSKDSEFWQTQSEK